MWGVGLGGGGAKGGFHSYDSADQCGTVQSQHGNSVFVFTTKGRKETNKKKKTGFIWQQAPPPVYKPANQNRAFIVVMGALLSVLR